MKKILIACLVLTGTLGIKAQDYIFDDPDNHAYWGARLGFDITALQSPSGIYGNRGGIEIGAIYHMPLWKNLYFEPGASLFYNSSSINGLPEYTGYDIQEGTINNWGIRIPLNVGYHFDVTDAIKIAPYTGPQFNINLSNTTHYLYIPEATVIGEDPRLHYNALDMGWNFGVGVTFQSYYIAVGGTVGLSRYVSNKPDVYRFPNSLSSTYPNYEYVPLYARRNVFSITLGYNF